VTSNAASTAASSSASVVTAPLSAARRFLG
jgi:hypothetical protein